MRFSLGLSTIGLITTQRKGQRPGSHAGIIRLRVWPTTIEETQNALERLLAEVPDTELARALVIIDRGAIRIRRSQ
ncbi:MAG: hypothetical protein OEV01_11600 [Nitrospira sp.]|nr:hypothetical protein [Nitrospira sp.]MDH4303126.1 hypothetical protein [Nitrospira sp.]MDH5192455.1 hypothetical protein [Nitrospira sp.]